MGRDWQPYRDAERKGHGIIFSDNPDYVFHFWTISHMAKYRRNNMATDDKRPPGLPAFDYYGCIVSLVNLIKKTIMEWIKNNFKQAVLIALLTVFLSTIGSIFVFTFSQKEAKLDGAASIEYVEKSVGDLKIYTDTQDNALTQRMNRIQDVQNTKVDQNDFDKLYLKTEENNRLLIEILMQIKNLE